MAPIDDVRVDVEKAERKIVEFFTAVDDLLGRLATAANQDQGPVLVSPALVDEVRRGADHLGREFRKVFDKLEAEIALGGDPDRLRAAAHGWTAMGNDLGATVGAIGLDRMRANIEWEGAAQRAYTAMVPAQADSLSATRTACVQLGTSLHGLADGLDAFWLAVDIAVVAVLLALAVCVVSALTGPGVLGGIAVALGALAALWALIGGVAPAMSAMLNRVDSEQRAITQTLASIGDQWRAPKVGQLASQWEAGGK